MKLESLKNGKFANAKISLQKSNSIVGSGSEATVTWTKASDKVDDSCSDCDAGGSASLTMY